MKYLYKWIVALSAMIKYLYIHSILSIIIIQNSVSSKSVFDS